MNTSRKGNLRELRTAGLLEAEGWTVGSRRHTGGAGDLLAVKSGERPLLIEVKSSGSPYMNFRRPDRAALVDEAKKAGAVAILAWWPPRARTHQLVDEVNWPTQ